LHKNVAMAIVKNYPVRSDLVRADLAKSGAMPIAKKGLVKSGAMAIARQKVHAMVTAVKTAHATAIAR
jgi:hypothetical protein